MKSALGLFVFIDACGWEIIRRRPQFLQRIAPHRRKLGSVLGYSSTCVPSILSGRWPDEHYHWCYFVYDPEKSPFKKLTALRRLPRWIGHRRRVRRWLSKAVKPMLKFDGYFDLYNVAFDRVGAFDFSEKTSPLKPGGMNRGSNIFDCLENRSIPYHVSDPNQAERRNLEALESAIESESVDFAFAYWPELDGLLHRVGNQSPEIDPKLANYEGWIESLMDKAREHYRDVRLYVFSDHGMANCDVHLDLRTRIEGLGLEWGRDYAVVYDSTMARFWFFNEAARRRVVDCLETVDQGRILPDDELKELRAFFPDRYFGELIFLADEGVLIVPSDMGERPIRAMHGYHPLDKHSYAALLTNQSDVPSEIQDIPDIYQLMERDAVWAHRRNEPPCAACPPDDGASTIEPAGGSSSREKSGAPASLQNALMIKNAIYAKVKTFNSNITAAGGLYPDL